MPTSVLEIVDLGDGEIVLRRAEGESDALVRIRFSDESRVYLMDNTMEVARAMIQAGIEAASNLSAVEEPEDEAETGHEVAPRVLH
ncbi:hypothetical protein [Parahaliea aestuarii]|uniref:Uncharacterized protein n=1 Tax=Parahaliea aestuarii TaxID=1852021 RepID=A0A5C9A0Q3_9GAMM|nr:hypothetical protein [Parahaliea aestuarii]TXS93177.1 hypothetical protein FVW59_04815 [Parahaliea aestuarii]